jgi:hypothetical protein
MFNFRSKYHSVLLSLDLDLYESVLILRFCSQLQHWSMFEHCKKSPLLPLRTFSLSHHVDAALCSRISSRPFCRSRTRWQHADNIPTPALAARLLSPAVSISTLSSTPLMPFSIVRIIFDGKHAAGPLVQKNILLNRFVHSVSVLARLYKYQIESLNHCQIERVWENKACAFLFLCLSEWQLAESIIYDRIYRPTLIYYAVAARKKLHSLASWYAIANFSHWTKKDRRE